MTKFIVKYDNYRCSYIELKGHSGYATYGSDIVCSGISASVFTSINLINKINPHCFNLSQDEVKGFLHMDILYQEVKNEEAKLINLIIQNLIDMLEEIKSQYPKNIEIEIFKEAKYD